MHRRALQLFALLLLAATAMTITVYAVRSTRDTPSSFTATATPTLLAPATDATPVLSSTPRTGGHARFVEAVAVDADNFNPIYSTNPTSLKVIEKIYPTLVGQDPYTSVSNTTGLAETWHFSMDSRTITFTLFGDLQWSDGEPIRATDVAFTYNLIREPSIASPYQQNFADIETLQVIDERTLVVQLATADCAIFQSFRQPILPAHLYHDEPAEFRATDPARFPIVGAGPFLFESRSGNRITLRRNDHFRFGAPLLEYYEFHIIPEAAQQLTELDAGRVDLISLSTEDLIHFQPSASIDLYKAPLDSITFLALNLANPRNPQPGRANDGSLLPQEPHPILGTLAVRQALAYALDYDDLIRTGFGGQMMRINSYLLPTIDWAYHDTLTPYRYDPTLAAQLLRDAGWVDSDGDGIREQDGLAMQLTLLTNEDSAVRVRLAEAIRTYLQAIGVGVEVRTLTFDQLTRELLDQRYDLVLIGWDTLGTEPGNSDFWLSQQDLPSSYDTNGIGGANFTSYQNVAVDLWLTEARELQRCEDAERASRYREVQGKIHADLPYIVLGAPLQGWAYRTGWQGIHPQPLNFFNNIHQWSFVEE